MWFALRDSLVVLIVLFVVLLDVVLLAVLLLDVARYKYPGAWVRAAQLFAAMNSTDDTSGRLG